MKCLVDGRGERRIGRKGSNLQENIKEEHITTNKEWQEKRVHVMWNEDKTSNKECKKIVNEKYGRYPCKNRKKK